MADIADHLLVEALQLPASARAALAASLIDSLDTKFDVDAEAQWAIEIRRRISALDAGAPTTPWPEARKRIVGE